VANAIAEMIAKAPPMLIWAIAGAVVGLAAAWALMAINPVVLAIAAVIIGMAEIVHYWPQISAAFVQGWQQVEQWTKVAADFITHTFDDVRHFMAHAGDDIASFFITGFDQVINFFVQLPGWLLNQGRLAITGLFNGFIGAWNSEFNFFQQIANFIAGIFTGLYNWMLMAGENIIIGIWNGIVSGFNSFISGISSIGKSIGNALLGWAGIHFNSPPSEAIYMVMAGERLNNDLAKGLNQSRSAVTAAMARTDAVVSAGTGSGAPQKVTLEFTGNANDQLWQLMKRNIRVRGGNVQIVGA
jgi:hypothetical protein